MPKPDPKLRTLLKRLSQGGGVGVRDIRSAFEEAVHGLNTKEHRSYCRDLLDQAAEHLLENGTSRARTAMLGALVLDPGLLPEIERRGLLHDATLGRRSREPLLDLLVKDGEGALDSLAPGFWRRLESYRNLARAQHDLAPAFEEYRQILADRPPNLIKTVVACADLGFLLRAASREHAEAIDASLPSINVWSLEELAEIASRIVAEAGEIAPLQQDDLNAEVAIGLADPLLAHVLKTAQARCALAEQQKTVVVFGYEVDREEGDPPTYVLQPTDAAFERKLRVSHAAEQVSRDTDYVKVLRSLSDEPATVLNVARMIAKGVPTMAYDTQQHPYPRVRPHLLHGSLVQGHFLKSQHLDDVLEWHLHEDLETCRTELRATLLRPRLTVGQFMDLFRLFRFQMALHSTAVLEGANGNSRMIANSVLPVVTREVLVGLVQSEGVSSETAEAFLDVLTWSPSNTGPRNTRHLELQYTPLLRLGARYLACPRLVLNANALRNTLSALQVRVNHAGFAFEERVAELLRGVFPHVATGRKYTILGEVGEIDIVVLHEGVVYLFECKHSLPAATIHEHRDLLDDIRKGAKQLCKAARLLPQDVQLVNRMSQWFPEAPKLREVGQLRFVSCVVTATRMFSGVELDGVPVRDVFSLTNVLTMGSVDRCNWSGAELHVRTYSYWKEESFCPADFHDYLRPDGVYWKVRESHAEDMRLVDASLPQAVLAKETCRVVHEVGAPGKPLEDLGLRLVNETRETVRVPRSAEAGSPPP